METYNLLQYKFFNQLCQLPFVEEIWLYGSRAREDARERSDIDLAIICPAASDENWLKITKIIEEADTLLKIDCIRYDSLNDNEKLKKNILQFKKVLYAKGLGLMEKEFWRDYFEGLGSAISRLKEGVNHPHTENDQLYRDATIQRFEFCIELFWKVLKKFLSYEKIPATTPRDTLQKSFQYELIDDEKVWLEMLDDRNRTSHIYKEAVAEEVYQKIKGYFPVIDKTYKNLTTRFEKM
jgi:nucleotidyltransferase substrate binding protein (TIGR01987 family)